MTYKIYITPQAYTDMIEILTYITDTFHDTIAANRLLNNINTSLKSLSKFPHRIPIIKNTELNTNEIRRMNIKNFSAYFYIDESEKTVHILTIQYSKRDYEKILIEIIKKL